MEKTNKVALQNAYRGKEVEERGQLANRCLNDSRLSYLLSAATLQPTSIVNTCEIVQ